MSEIYEKAKSLAALLAEDMIAADCCNSFVENGAKIAKEVRQKAESNNYFNDPVIRQYHSYEHTIYCAVYKLLEGKHGYRLIKNI